MQLKEGSGGISYLASDRPVTATDLFWAYVLGAIATRLLFL